MQARHEHPSADPLPDGPPDEPSKSRAKRAAADLKTLGDELVALPAPELAALELPEQLRDAIDLAQRISAHGARVRQRQYIGKLLRRLDVGQIHAAIAARQLARRLEAREFHRLESWRARLIAEGRPAIEALLAIEPGLDAAQLAKLVTAARAEAAAGGGPAAARALLRWLRAALAPVGPSA
jgi:ribosome-associated protein